MTSRLDSTSMQKAFPQFIVTVCLLASAFALQSCTRNDEAAVQPASVMPSYDSRLMEASRLMQDNRLDDAKFLYLEVLGSSENPQHKLNAAHQLAEIFEQTGQDETAIGYYQQSAALSQEIIENPDRYNDDLVSHANMLHVYAIRRQFELKERIAPASVEEAQAFFDSIAERTDVDQLRRNAEEFKQTSPRFLQPDFYGLVTEYSGALHQWIHRLTLHGEYDRAWELLAHYAEVTADYQKEFDGQGQILMWKQESEPRAPEAAIAEYRRLIDERKYERVNPAQAYSAIISIHYQQSDSQAMLDVFAEMAEKCEYSELSASSFWFEHAFLSALGSFYGPNRPIDANRSKFIAEYTEKLPQLIENIRKQEVFDHLFAD